MPEKTGVPIVLRQNMIFLIYRLFMAQMIFMGTYLILELPVLLLLDKEISTPEIELQADLYGLALLFVLSLIEMVIIVFIVLRWYTSYYEIREDDIMEKHGLITLRENTHSYRNFAAISVSQGILGRIFNFGTVILFNPALNHKLVMKRISSPTSCIKLISERIPKTGENLILKK